MTRSICILLGTVPLWFAGSAFAQATPDGAAALRDGLTEMLKPILSTQIQGKPLFSGPITVDPAGADYTVVFPATDLVLTVDKAAKAGPKTLTAHCDAQIYRATASGSASYRLETAQPISCMGQIEGEPEVTLTTQALQAHMVVDLDQKLFSESGWQIDGLAVGQEGKPKLVTVDRFVGTGAFTPTADPARYDGNFRMEATGISGFDTTGTQRVTLGDLVYKGRMAGMDVPLIFSTYGDVIQAYAGMLDTIGAADQKQMEQLPAETMRKMTGVIKRMMGAYGDSGDFSATMNDLRVNAPDVQVTLDSLRIGEGFAGASTAKGSGTMTVEMAGLGLAPKPAFAQWIPADATIDLQASNIPWADVGTAYFAMIDASADQATNPGAANQKAMQAMAQMGDVLRRAGSRLDITTFHIQAPDAAINLGGAVQGDAAAAHGLTANLKLRFTNLDGVIHFLQGQPGGAQVASGLTVFQVLGHQATTDAGKPARDYEFMVDTGGKIVLNGTDLSTLMPKK
jgi:hypothetical protein